MLLVCILVWLLNCVQGFIVNLCGVCEFCVLLVFNVFGSIDVVELDVVSYGGVDDICELWDCVFYVLVQLWYWVFIVDEVYMVIIVGFNVLFKIVEELFEYLIFIFVIIELEKVLLMIWLCIYYYLFWLLLLCIMWVLFVWICEQEGVVVDDVVYLLVIWVGGGFLWDMFLVLD